MDSKRSFLVRIKSPAEVPSSADDLSRNVTTETNVAHTELIYHLYRRRWYGVLVVLAMNFMSSWGWATYTTISSLSATFFNTSENAINAFSVAYMASICACAPAVIWMVHHLGFRFTLLVGAVGLAVGCWLRYVAAMIEPPSYALTMVGQVVLGMTGTVPMILPSHYSGLWFGDDGKVVANALMSLANPAGAAAAQLVAPAIVTNAKNIPDLTLCIAIIATIVMILSVLVPAKPPTPPAEDCENERLHPWTALVSLSKNISFYMIFLPFIVYVGLFNSMASLIYQIFSPYGVSTDSAGYLGAALIGSGLVAAVILSPLIGSYQAKLLTLRIIVPLVGICYLVLIWIPGQPIESAYVLLSVLGIVSFTLLPVSLEWLAEDSRPISPEVSSTLCWMGGQLLGVLFTLIEQSLKSYGDSSVPNGDMTRALIFQAVFALVCAPLPICLCFFKKKAA